MHRQKSVIWWEYRGRDRMKYTPHQFRLAIAALFAAGGCALQLHAQQNPQIKYVLVTGQSNAEGYNDGSGENAVNPNVFAWDCSANQWNVMQEGVRPMGTL